MPSAATSESVTREVPVVVAGATSVGGGKEARLLISETSDPAADVGSEEIEYQTVAVTQTTSNGEYNIGLSDLTALTKRANGDGDVNVMIAAPTPDGHEPVDAVINIADTPTPTLTDTVIIDDPAKVAGPGPVDSSPDVGTVWDESEEADADEPSSSTDGIPDRVELRHTSTDAAVTPQGSGTSGQPTGKAAGPQDVYWCTSKKHSYVAKRRTYMISHYSNTTSNRVKAVATVERGSSSRIGVAGSASGKGSTFSRTGEVSRERSSTTRFTPAWQGSYRHYSNVNYYKYKQTCYTDTGYRRTKYHVKPTTVLGGAYLRKVQNPSAWKCEGYSPGSNYLKDEGRAWKHSSGVNLSGIIGVDLSAQTGYRRNARISFIGAAGKRYRLCGTNHGPETANRIVARNP